MNAGLETSNSFGYARTAKDTRWANRPAPGEAMRAHAQPHLRADQPAYISSCHTHTGLSHKLVTLPPILVGPALEANKGGLSARGGHCL